MRIDKRDKRTRYLEVRIQQLQDEIPKNEGDEMTQQWYNRLVQELQWVVDVGESEDKKSGRSNCWMGENVQWWR